MSTMKAILDVLRRLATHRATPWLIYAAALGMRLVLGFALLEPRAPVTADALVYDTLARGIVERGVFEDPPGHPTAHRMPGYPLFLAAIYAMGGTAPVVARVIQVFLSATGPVGLFLLARHVFGPLPAIIAALLAVIDPFLIFYDYQLWAESLGIVIVVWSLYLYIVHLAPNPTPARSALGGLLAGLAANLRPDFILLVPTFGCWAIFGVRPFAKAVKSTVIMGAACVAAILPWIVRNAITLGHFVPLTTESGFIMWQSNNTDLLADPELWGGYVPFPGHPGWDYQNHPDLDHDPRFAGYKDEVDLDKKLRAEVFTFWSEHWREMPRFVLGKWVKLLAITPFHAYWPQLFVWVSRIWYSVMITSFFVGVAISVVQRRPIGLLMSFLGWFLFRIALFMSVFRYRLQIEPLFLLFAGVTMAWLADKLVPRAAGGAPAGQAPPASAVTAA
ncbi:MAG: glycosyltransferase family 39 protein [bacterium]